MRRDIKIRKMDLIKKYTSPKLGDLIKEMNTTRSAFYKYYVNDENVEKVFLQVVNEVEELKIIIQKINEDENIIKFIETSKQVILDKYKNKKYISIEDFESEINEIIKEREKNEHFIK